MRKLIVILTDQEKILLGKELEKLFTLNSRKLDAEAKAVFIEKMAEVGLPFSAYIYGLRNLMLDDVQKITIGIILDASRKKIEETPLDPVDCEHCGKSGAISMREVIREDDSDEEMLGYEFTIACICTNGENYKRINECPRWNGKDYQYNGPRLLKMSWPISGVKGNDRRIDSNNNRPNDNGRDSLDGEEVPF